MRKALYIIRIILSPFIYVVYQAAMLALPIPMIVPLNIALVTWNFLAGKYIKDENGRTEEDFKEDCIPMVYVLIGPFIWTKCFIKGESTEL